MWISHFYLKPKTARWCMYIKRIFHQTFFSSKENDIKRSVSRRRNNFIFKEGTVKMDGVSGNGKHLNAALSIQVENFNLSENG